MRLFHFTLIILIQLLLWTTVEGQSSFISYKDAPPKLQKRFNKAQSHASSNQFAKAHKLLDQIIRNNPEFVDPYLLQASVYKDQNKITESIQALEKAMHLAPNYKSIVYKSLAVLYTQETLYNKAFDYQKIYVQKIPDSKKRKRKEIREMHRLAFIIEAMDNPVPYNAKTLSENINTPEFSEYLPSFTADGTKMVFTRRQGQNEDIFYSSRTDVDSDWELSIPIEIYNSSQNEGAYSISMDGKSIVFTKCGINPDLDHYNSCDLFEVSLINGKWSLPRSLNEINTFAWESQPSLSDNGQLLLFSSNRKQGFGKKDIYFSKKQKNGRWSTPVNAGKHINTNGDEASPFLHADGKTLYFMSDGHLGLGKSDLFITRKVNGNWLPARNLGYPINSIDQEGALVVALDGKTAYYSIGDSETDIVQFELTEISRAYPVNFITGQIVNALTDDKIQGRIKIYDANGHEHVNIDSKADGSFLMTLPVGSAYSFQVQKEGYVFFSERFKFSETSTFLEPIEIKINLNKIEKIKPESNITVVLKNVLFKTGSSSLKSTSFNELEILTTFLIENSAIHIEIQGHTDNIGSQDANQKLSENRAKTIFEYLKSKSISAERLSYIGYGEAQPIDSNETKEGRSNNRRTAFKIVQ